MEGPVSHYFRPRHHTQRESRVLRWTRKRREVACCSILVRRERLLSTCRRVEGVRTLVLSFLLLVQGSGLRASGVSAESVARSRAHGRDQPEMQSSGDPSNTMGCMLHLLRHACLHARRLPPPQSRTHTHAHSSAGLAAARGRAHRRAHPIAKRFGHSRKPLSAQVVFVRPQRSLVDLAVRRPSPRCNGSAWERLGARRGRHPSSGGVRGHEPC